MSRKTSKDPYQICIWFLVRCPPPPLVQVCVCAHTVIAWGPPGACWAVGQVQGYAVAGGQGKGLSGQGWFVDHTEDSYT